MFFSMAVMDTMDAARQDKNELNTKPLASCQNVISSSLNGTGNVRFRSKQQQLQQHTHFLLEQNAEAQSDEMLRGQGGNETDATIYV